MAYSSSLAAILVSGYYELRTNEKLTLPKNVNFKTIIDFPHRRYQQWHNSCFINLLLKYWKFWWNMDWALRSFSRFALEELPWAQAIFHCIFPIRIQYVLSLVLSYRAFNHPRGWNSHQHSNYSSILAVFVFRIWFSLGSGYSSLTRFDKSKLVKFLLLCILHFNLFVLLVCVWPKDWSESVTSCIFCALCHYQRSNSYSSRCRFTNTHKHN